MILCRSDDGRKGGTSDWMIQDTDHSLSIGMVMLQPGKDRFDA